MSIITRKGDHGQTDLLFGRRVSKNHPRVEANGAIDELNASLGLVRWHARSEGLTALDLRLEKMQRQLIGIMGEVATLDEDHSRLQPNGFQLITTDEVEQLTREASNLETALNDRFKDWALPGHSGPASGAFLDQSRTFCRRAERLVWAISEASALGHVLAYLNRLADYLWLLARAVDKDPAVLETPSCEKEA